MLSASKQRSHSELVFTAQCIGGREPAGRGSLYVDHKEHIDSVELKKGEGVPNINFYLSNVQISDVSKVYMHNLHLSKLK